MTALQSLVRGSAHSVDGRRHRVKVRSPQAPHRCHDRGRRLVVLPHLDGVHAQPAGLGRHIPASVAASASASPAQHGYGRSGSPIALRLPVRGAPDGRWMAQREHIQVLVDAERAPRQCELSCDWPGWWPRQPVACEAPVRTNAGRAHFRALRGRNLGAKRHDSGQSHR